LGQGYSFDRVIRQMDQTAEGLSSVDPILVLAAAKGVSMPIVSQVQQVLQGTLDPRELAPHLATDSAIPSEE
jgi:glycerol-3-phosphate dehydrogenase (NAD(P)+)